MACSLVCKRRAECIYRAEHRFGGVCLTMFPTTERIRLPSRQPTLLFTVELPQAYSHVHDLPVCIGELLLCVAGSSRFFPDRRLRPAQTTVLVALDRHHGGERFRLEVPTRALTGEITTSLVATEGPDETILLAVLQHEDGLSVFVLAPDGCVLWEEQPYTADKHTHRLTEVHLRTYDLSIKHWLSPVFPGPMQGYLVSWLYRQDRFARMEYRRPGGDLPLWSQPAWAVGRCGHIVFGATVPRAQSRLVAYDLATGTPLWSIAGREAILAAVEREFVVVVYRPPTWEDAIALAPKSTSNHGPIWPLAGMHCPPILAHEPATGERLWSLWVPGYVVSLACGPGHMCAIVATETGHPLLLCADREGHLLWQQVLTSSVAERLVRWERGGPAMRPAWPMLVAVDAASLLLETPEQLTCLALHDGSVRWHCMTPAVRPSFLPRSEDRMVSRSCTLVHNGILYRREGTRLWAYAENQSALSE